LEEQLRFRDAHDANFTNYSGVSFGAAGGTGLAATLGAFFSYVETPMLIKKKLKPLRSESKMLMAEYSF
jgi:hypothetical protein